MLANGGVVSASLEHVDVSLTADVDNSARTLGILFQFLTQTGYVDLDYVLSFGAVGLVAVHLAK